MIPCKVLKNHLVFQPKDVAALRPIFTTLRETPGCNYVAVPHSLESARLLRNMGIDAPSPIRTEYGWPIKAGWSPGWWQINTSEFLTLNPRAYVLSTMRVRKTLSTLWAADYLMKKKVVKQVLVVSPLSTLERVWGDHIFLHFHHRSFAVLHGTAEKRKRLLDQPHDFYIINHDGLEIVREEIEKRPDINLIIIDECAVLRNAQTKRWKTMKKIVTPERLCWGLTGTPTPNEPTDAYGQMKIITPEKYNGHFTRFKNDVMLQLGPFKWVPRKGAEEIVKRVLSPSIRFTREVVTDMEPTYIERTAELSEQQKKHVTALLKECVTQVDSQAITAVNAAVLISKITQVACGIAYDAQGGLVKFDFGPRLKVLEELIEENEEKVLVFVPFTGVLNALKKELEKRWTVETVDGSTSSGKRNQIFKDFQDRKDPHVIIAHPQTMAHGLELTRASLVVWYAPCNKNEIYQQACARIDGGGQKVKIDIAHIEATRVERRIYAALKEKGRLQDVVLDLIQGKVR